MKRVAVFGSGRVAGPAVRTLLEGGVHVVIATNDVPAGHALLDGHENGSVIEADARNAEAVQDVVGSVDLAMSLLPVEFHGNVARACVEHRKSFVTTSYVSPGIRALNASAREVGILLLNEVGADPGLDHMQAMRIVDRIRRDGGSVRGLYSVCGGIPAPSANDNPFGYKLSWSTRGVVLAGQRPAQFRRDHETFELGPYEIFDHVRSVQVEGLGELESYPNGDSIRFEEEYGLHGLRSSFEEPFDGRDGARLGECLPSSATSTTRPCLRRQAPTKTSFALLRAAARTGQPHWVCPRSTRSPGDSSGSVWLRRTRSLRKSTRVPAS